MLKTDSRIEVRVESSLTPEARELISKSQAALTQVYSPEEIFSVNPEELAAPNAQFLVARDRGEAVGCVALMDMMSYGEIKRLFVDSQARGRGLGRDLMRAAEELARDIGLRLLRLETGPELAEAVALYRDLDYKERSRYGDYKDQACSLFMEKRLA